MARSRQKKRNYGRWAAVAGLGLATLIGLHQLYSVDTTPQEPVKIERTKSRRIYTPSPNQQTPPYTSPTAQGQEQTRTDLETLTQTDLYADRDGDGFGDEDSSPLDPKDVLKLEDGKLNGVAYVEDKTDCDDTNGAIHPGAPERCDYQDNDCNGLVNDGDPEFERTGNFYGDGESCPPESVYGTPCGDYSDAKWVCGGDSFSICVSDTLSMTQETCNRRDDDCNDLIDEGDVCAGADVDWSAEDPSLPPEDAEEEGEGEYKYVTIHNRFPDDGELSWNLSVPVNYNPEEKHPYGLTRELTDPEKPLQGCAMHHQSFSYGNEGKGDGPAIARGRFATINPVTEQTAYPLERLRYLKVNTRLSLEFAGTNLEAGSKFTKESDAFGAMHLCGEGSNPTTYEGCVQVDRLEARLDLATEQNPFYTEGDNGFDSFVKHGEYTLTQTHNGSGQWQVEFLAEGAEQAVVLPPVSTSELTLPLHLLVGIETAGYGGREDGYDNSQYATAHLCSVWGERF